MQLSQTLVRNLELHPAGRISLDEINKIPWNQPGWNPLKQRSECSHGNDALQQATDCSTSANIYGADLELNTPIVGFWMQVQVIHANHLPPVDVNDLLVQKIAFQQEQPLGLGCRPIGRWRRRAHSPVQR